MAPTSAVWQNCHPQVGGRCWGLERAETKGRCPKGILPSPEKSCWEGQGLPQGMGTEPRCPQGPGIALDGVPAVHLDKTTHLTSATSMHAFPHGHEPGCGHCDALRHDAIVTYTDVACVDTTVHTNPAPHLSLAGPAHSPQETWCIADNIHPQTASIPSHTQAQLYLLTQVWHNTHWPHPHTNAVPSPGTTTQVTPTTGSSLWWAQPHTRVCPCGHSCLYPHRK
jgi:hypothetical protein